MWLISQGLRAHFGSGFSAHTKPAPNSPGPWKSGSWQQLQHLGQDQPANLDFPAGASGPFLCGCSGGLATAQFVKWAFKSFVFSLILSINIDGALPWGLGPGTR